MQYPVIVEQKNGRWRAVIPALSDLSADGASYDEAVDNAQRAAEAYLAQVVLTTIEVNAPPSKPLNPRRPQTWIQSAGKFKGDEAAMRQHIEEIYAERRRQREAAEREDESATPD